MPYLIYREGSETRHLKLAEAEVTIGRGHLACLRFRSDAKMSGVHCAIRYRDDGYYLKDEGSRNGTYLDGNPVYGDQDRRLEDGNEIRVGGTVVRFVEDLPTLGKPAAPSTPAPVERRGGLGGLLARLFGRR